MFKSYYIVSKTVDLNIVHIYDIVIKKKNTK